MRRRNGDLDLERDLLVLIVEMEAADEAERDRAGRGADESGSGLLERRLVSLLSADFARISSATPLLGDISTLQVILGSRTS